MASFGEDLEDLEDLEDYADAEAEGIADRVELKAAGISEEQIDSALKKQTSAGYEDDNEDLQVISDSDIMEQFNAYAEDNGEDVDGTLSIEGLIAGLRSDQDGPLGDLNDEEMMLYFEEIGLEIVDDHIDFYEFKKFVTSMIDNSVDEGEGED